MSKNPSIPRLSIIVPVGDDVSAFEDSLVSALENQPAGCEILVAHDGSYDDPFDLAGEVRFVTADRCQQVGLIAAATAHARGRFVHVLSSGFEATCDWADAALAQFECQDAAAVTPVIRNAKDNIVAAGWGDHSGRLCHPIAAGAAQVDRSDACQVLGPYLQASFWRRDVLCKLLAAFDAPNTVEATYAFGRMLIASHWCCALAADSRVVMQQRIDLSGPSTFARGQRLWAIKKAIDPTTRNVAWTKVLASFVGTAGLAETWGQVKGPKALGAIQARLRMESVSSHSDDCGDLSIPNGAAGERITHAA